MGGVDARRAAGPTRPDERVRGTGPPTSPALDRLGNGPVQGHAQEKRRFPPDPPSHGRNTRQLNESSTPLAGTSVDGSEQVANVVDTLYTAVSSGSNVSGPRPAEPLGFNNVSPMMARLFTEVSHAAAGMKRETAAAIVAKLYETYKDKIDLEQKAYGLTEESAEADCLTTSR